jgi:putative protein-disulfide isomerase
MEKTLIYFADPMCSWCWGFQPVMSKIRERVDGLAETVIFVGGLRPFTDHAMTEKDKGYVRNHWNHVFEASGQPFDFAFFERENFVYDTEPACRAVVAARRMDEGKSHPMLDRLHRAFYAECQDTTDPEVIANLATEIGLDRDAYKVAFEDESSRQETLAEFQYTQRSQINGFPTLVGVTEGRRPVALTMGFRPWEAMEPIVESWLAEEVGEVDPSLEKDPPS